MTKFLHRINPLSHLQCYTIALLNFILISLLLALLLSSFIYNLPPGIFAISLPIVVYHYLLLLFRQPYNIIIPLLQCRLLIGARRLSFFSLFLFPSLILGAHFLSHLVIIPSDIL